MLPRQRVLKLDGTLDIRNVGKHESVFFYDKSGDNIGHSDAFLLQT